MTFKDIKDAIEGALVSKGKNKNKLKAKCPPMNTPEAAAWQAIMSHANPYKVGIAHIMFMTQDNRAIFEAVDNLIKISELDVRNLDRDRMVLEELGAW